MPSSGTVVESASARRSGLREEVQTLVLRDGSSVVIRGLAAGDEAGIASWFTGRFAGLGAETLYARLFALFGWLDRLKGSSPEGADVAAREPIAAFAPDGVGVGIAWWVPVTEAATAEVVVAVAETWQGRGLATALLEQVATRARSFGIRQLTARCPVGSGTLIRVLSRLGSTAVVPSSVGLVDVRVDLGGGLRRTPVGAGRAD
jgi:GNAT superfamily N-acetyltransferase